MRQRPAKRVGRHDSRSRQLERRLAASGPPKPGARRALRPLALFSRHSCHHL